MTVCHIQLTLVFSKSKGFAETLQDICILTYQICRTEEKINQIPHFTNEVCNLTLKVRGALKIFWNRGEIPLYEQFLLLATIFCYLLLDFRVKTGTIFSPRDSK